MNFSSSPSAAVSLKILIFDFSYLILLHSPTLQFYPLSFFSAAMTHRRRCRHMLALAATARNDDDKQTRRREEKSSNRAEERNVRERVEKSSTKTRKTSFPNHHHQLFLEDEDGDINSSTLEFARVVGRFGVVVGVPLELHRILLFSLRNSWHSVLTVCLFVLSLDLRASEQQHLSFPPLNLFFITFLSDDHNNNNNYKRNGKQAMVSTFPESHVLAYFQCPFQDNGQLSCSYLVHFKTSQYRSGCPFGHQVNMTSNADQQQQQIQLRELPPYVCFAYLSHGCCNAAVSSGNSGGDISISASTNNSNALPRCTEGFHPSMEDLVDLEQLHQKMAFHILSGDAKAAKQVQQQQKQLLIGKAHSGITINAASPRSPAAGGTDEEQHKAEESTEAKRLKKEEAEKLSENTLHADDQCCVCLESVSGGGGGSDGSSGDRLFGLTEGCAHVFCSDCLLTWCEGRVAVANRNTHKCPTCRVETGKVLVAQRLPASEAEKAKLFAQQYKCMAISRRAMTPPLISDSDDDDEDEDDDDDDDDDDENFTMNLPAIMRVVARVARVLENAEDDEDEDEGEGEGEGDNVDGEDNNAVNNGDDRHVFNFDNPSLRRVLTLEDIEEDDGEEEEEEEQEQAVHLPVINGTVYIDPSTLLRFSGRPRQLQNRRPVAAGGDAAAGGGGGDGGGGERIGEGGDGGAEDGAGSAASSTGATHGSSSQDDEDEDDEDGEEENRFDEMDISPEID